jgi:photoactive yellow protein
MRTICAWCVAEMRPSTDPTSSLVSHGVCLSCCHRFGLLPSEGIPSLEQSDVESLPFGVIILDDQGLIRQYNAAESAISGFTATDVIGLDFFVDVAPCANVQGFAGKVAELRATGISGRAEFEFVFVFKNGEMLVEIVCLYDGTSGHTTMLVAATT